MCSLSSRPCRCSPWCWKCRSVSLAAFQGDWHGFKREDGLNLTRIQIWTQRICSNFSSLSPQHICFASSSDCIFFLNTSAPAGDWVWHQNLRKWFNITLSIPLTWPHTCLHTYTHILTRLQYKDLCTWAPLSRTSHPCPVYDIALLLDSLISPSVKRPRIHVNQGSRTPASHGSAITEWIDSVWVCVLNAIGDYD